ncbi:Complexin [Portunus trituberculatus]|uniref:Complexin n=1 Tax=Portunus trituberculatus TaxID=210409 RepID=A0A5B7E3I6_PORTR|nr:Complexin [Portunus trituberculatus]
MPEEPQMPDNPLMRKKKTPEELAAEAEAEDQDDFTKLKNTIETQINEVKQQIEVLLVNNPNTPPMTQPPSRLGLRCCGCRGGDTPKRPFTT